MMETSRGRDAFRREAERLIRELAHSRDLIDQHMQRLGA
jgi:hypothetical protein